LPEIYPKYCLSFSGDSVVDFGLGMAFYTNWIAIKLDIYKSEIEIILNCIYLFKFLYGDITYLLVT